MAKAFTPTVINKFKGIRYDPPELTGMDDAESPNMLNFNVDPSGFLIKRRGAATIATIAAAAGSGLRVHGIQRLNPLGTNANLIFGTQPRLYRAALPGVTAPTEIFDSAAANISNVQWIAEYGTAANPYNMIVIRNNVGTAGLCSILNTGAGFGPMANTPQGTHFTVFKDRGFALDSTSSTGLESRLWYSNPGDLGATGWGGVGMPNNIDIGIGDGDFLVATVPYNDQLIIFKSRKTYVLTADGTPTSWTVRLLNDAIGCTGRGSVKVINGFIYFLSADGVYKTDGTTFQLISDNVRSITSANRDYRAPSAVLNVDAAYWDDKYILWLPTTGPSNLTAVVWDLRSECWVRWSFAGSVNMAGAARYNEYSPDTLYMGDMITNRIYGMGGGVYQDNGSSYVASWTTREMEFGDATAMKRNHLVLLDVAPNFNAPSPFTLSAVVDSITRTAQPTQSSDTNWRKILKFRGAGYGRWFSTSFAVTDQYPQSIYSITFMNESKSLVPRQIP